MNRMGRAVIAAALLSVSPLSAIARAEPGALAKAFGARETVISASLSLDGGKIALIAAGAGRTTKVYVMEAKEGVEPKSVLVGSGKPEYLQSCDWVSGDRLACEIAGQSRFGDHVYTFSNIVAVDAAGGNVKLLSQRRGENALSYDFRGGGIVDLLPGQDGAILMARSYVPEAKVGSLIERRAEGLGVDRVDTRSGAIKRIESPEKLAVDYVSDGRGNVRIMGVLERKESGYDTGKYNFLYRRPGQSQWSHLSTYDQQSAEGFLPMAIDPDKNIAYGFEKTNGRDAVVSVTLDPSLQKSIVFAHPRVDVTGLVRVGREQRVVGASYSDEYRETVYFDPAIAALTKTLGKALGVEAVHIRDMSADGQRVLVWAGSDINPGQYYLYDKAARKLSPVMPDRPELVGMTLAPMKPVSFKAGDGTTVPAYLTLPPGKADAKGLPAIVLPHGGPEARDEWGFDWLVQYYAARGFAVIQPQFRGSYGFGDKWLMENGYKSWRTAISDVVDAGRWLVSQGIADPARLTIAGWSYGGYAALQAQVIDPKLFKAVVAIAPVTDFGDRIRRSRFWSDYYLQQQRMGRGGSAEDASPANHAAEFLAPVLLFHGTEDANVDITQSKIMHSKLQAAGKRSNLVIYEGLQHSLIDSDARADMLQQSADFLLAAGK
ncbi:MAG: alpha/beta fold hydrolase [bacterium]|nr:alpha/beta fold hydrolase [bacterium]